MLVTTQGLSSSISGAAVTPAMKAAFDAKRKRRSLTVAQADREAWANWINEED